MALCGLLPLHSFVIYTVVETGCLSRFIARVFNDITLRDGGKAIRKNPIWPTLAPVALISLHF